MKNSSSLVLVSFIKSITLSICSLVNKSGKFLSKIFSKLGLVINLFSTLNINIPVRTELKALSISWDSSLFS